MGSAQHGDFLAQYQEFDVFGRRRAAEQQQQVHQLAEDQLEQTQGPGSRSCRAGQAHRPRRSEAQADFWNPTGLVGIKDRVEATGGTMDPHSYPGEGTRLVAELPVDIAEPSSSG